MAKTLVLPILKDILNSRIKHREPFRPFCPSVLAGCVGEYFETDYPSPFMVMAFERTGTGAAPPKPSTASSAPAWTSYP